MNNTISDHQISVGQKLNLYFKTIIVIEIERLTNTDVGILHEELDPNKSKLWYIFSIVQDNQDNKNDTISKKADYHAYFQSQIQHGLTM